VNFTVAADAPPGMYDLAVGLYTWPDFTRLPVGEDDTYMLAQIAIRP
jgi:hypothetical protein